MSLIGYRGERCVPSLEANSNIHKYYVPQPFASVSRKYFLLYAPIKVLLQVRLPQLLWPICGNISRVLQILSILWLLLVTIPRPKAVLVQNPPSIPALACVWLACRLRGSKFVIDWHNFGYTILALSRGANSPLVNVRLTIRS